MVHRPLHTSLLMALHITVDSLGGLAILLNQGILHNFRMHHLLPGHISNLAKLIR